MSSGYLHPSSSSFTVKNKQGLQKKSASARGALGDGAQVQNYKNARVYLFNNDSYLEDEISEGTSADMPELRPRGAAARRENQDTLDDREQNDLFFEWMIEPTDSLHSLALKYGCPLSELKRVNNLIRDQDFYGLKSLKIPVKQHGVLTELIEEQQNRAAATVTDSTRLEAASPEPNSPYEESYQANDFREDYLEELGTESEEERRRLLVRTLSIGDAFGKQSRDAAAFLKKMDQDIKKIVKTSNSRKDTLEEVRETLTCKSIHPLVEKRTIFDGVDCGMRWWSVLIVTFLVLIGVPLFYFLYLEYVKQKR